MNRKRANPFPSPVAKRQKIELTQADNTSDTQYSQIEDLFLNATMVEELINTIPTGNLEEVGQIFKLAAIEILRTARNEKYIPFDVKEQVVCQTDSLLIDDMRNQKLIRLCDITSFCTKVTVEVIGTNLFLKESCLSSQNHSSLVFDELNNNCLTSFCFQKKLQ